MPLDLYLAYLAACFILTIVPGPTVALIVANALTHGTRAGLLNVAGTQAALAVMMAILIVGLSSVVEAMGLWFDWLRLIGAAYLIWLGWKLLRSSGSVDAPEAAARPRGGFFLQGFVVMLGNPKVLIFFGAFIPQFMTPHGDVLGQTVLLCATAMAIALLSDSAYAILTGRARALFSRRRVRLMSRISGATLIGGGVWLAFTRSR